MNLVLEFFWVLLKVLFLILVAIVKSLNPFKSSQKKDVRGDIVLVTGAGSGIGRLMAIRFAKLGAKLILWDINREANEAVADEIRQLKGTAHSYVCDCSKKEDIFKIADKVKREVGDVTILINNAGIVSGKKFMDVPDKLVDLTFQVNTLAHFWTIKSFLPDMMAKNKGHVITIASGAGIFGIAGLMDYCGSKFGAVGIHQSVVSELHAHGITGVNTTLVCPYYINTGMFDGVKTRIPAILPILDAEYAVDKILEAFHGNQLLLMMPKLLYLFYFLQPIMPSDALQEAGKFFGVNQTMDTFKGREKKD